MVVVLTFNGSFGDTFNPLASMVPFTSISPHTVVVGEFIVTVVEVFVPRVTFPDTFSPEAFKVVT